MGSFVQGVYKRGMYKHPWTCTSQPGFVVFGYAMVGLNPRLARFPKRRTFGFSAYLDMTHASFSLEHEPFLRQGGEVPRFNEP